MSIAAPVFLLGLFALIVPWLLHRLNQHDAPIRDFPSALFLEATTAASARKKNLRYLRLLALRLLLLAALCLLFAEPALNRIDGLLGDQDQLHMIVLDTSFSMQREGMWSSATEAVNEILDSRTAGEPMQLFSAGKSLQELTAITLDKQVISAALVGLAPGFAHLQYGDLTRQLSALAEQSELPVAVHLVSDMQASGMPVRASELINREFATLALYDVNVPGNDAVANINHALRIDSKPRDQDSFDMVVELSRYSQSDSSTGEPLVAGPGRELVLSKDGERVASRSVSEGTNDTLVFTFDSLRWPAPSVTERYQAQLIPSDALVADDQAIIAIQKEPIVPVAIISNTPRQSRSQSVEELYLTTALQLDPRNRVSTHALESLNLPADVDLIIYLDNFDRQGEGLPEIPDHLVRLQREGKHILYILNAPSLRLEVPSEVVSAVSTHPLELNLGAWEDVRFYAHQALDLRADQTALLTAGAGYPLLIEQQMASSGEISGRLLWLNAALNGADNSLPVSPVFVPFLNDVVDYFVRADAYPAQLTVGDGLRLKQSLQMLDPAGDAMLNLAERSRESTQIVSRPGIYTLLEANAEFPIKVVVDLAESDVRVADTADVERWQLGSGDTNDPAQAAVTTADTVVAESEYALMHWLLPICLLLLLLESLYANWHLRTRRTA